jgi:O-antigen/teichoic acid export membrane protein
VSAGRVETRAAKVALATGLSTVLSVVLQLVSVPLYLRFWGNETYGLWLALVALFTLLRTLDSGFTAYVGNELNLSYHRDPLELRKTLASGLCGSIVVGSLQLFAGGLIAASGSLSDLLGVPEEVAREGRAALALGVLLVGWVFMGPYLGIVHRLLVPAGMLYQATWWLMAVQIVQTASLIAAVASGCSITEASVVFSVAQLGIYVASAFYIARKLPEYFPWWKHPSWVRGLRDFGRSLVMVGANLMTQTGSSGLVMLISSGLGAAVVPVFTTVRTIANLWTMLGNVLISPLLPEVVRYHAQRDGRRLVAAFQAQSLIASCAVNLSILACFPFLDELYRRWTGGRIALDAPLLSCLLLSAAISTPAALITHYLAGINQLRAVTAIFAARGLVPFGIGLALLPALGVTGIGVAVAVGEVAGPVCLGLLHFRRQLDALGTRADPSAWAPIALGTSTVAVFLVAEATGGPGGGAAYAAALVGALVSAVWGWRRVDAEVRERILRLLRRRSR